MQHMRMEDAHDLKNESPSRRDIMQLENAKKLKRLKHKLNKRYKQHLNSQMTHYQHLIKILTLFQG